MSAIFPKLIVFRLKSMASVLIAIQMAFSLTILPNALHIAAQRMAQVLTTSGTAESALFVISNKWIDSTAPIATRLRTDLETLRSLPGVEGAFASQAYPLEGGGMALAFSAKPDDPGSFVPASVYFGDQQTVPTLGLRLIAGKNITATSVSNAFDDFPITSGILITRALANKLFPTEDALGRIVTMRPTDQAVPVIGIIERLQSSYVGAPGSKDMLEQSAVLPLQPAWPAYFYLVRADPARLREAMKQSEIALYRVDRNRLISAVRSLPEARKRIFWSDQALAAGLSVVCTIVLLVAGMGTVSISSYSMARRHFDIGVCRALGASRMRILAEVLLGTLTVSVLAVLVGAVLAIGLNLWLMTHYTLDRLPISAVVWGALAICVTGQLAALYPAIIAANVSPATAVRGIRLRHTG